MKFDILYKYLVEGKDEAYTLFETGAYFAKGGQGALDIERDPKGVTKILGNNLDKIKKNPNDSTAANIIFKILEISNFKKKYTVKTQGKEVTLSANQILKRILEDTRHGGVTPTHRFRDPAKKGKVDKNGKPFYLPSDNSHEKIVYLDIFQFGQSGGNKELARLYEKIYTHLGKPWKSFRRRQDTPIDREREKDVVYWWGVDKKPYRTALKVDQNGFIPKGALFTTDRFQDKQKPKPLALSNVRIKADLTPEQLRISLRIGEYLNFLNEKRNGKITLGENPEVAYRRLYTDPKHYTLR